MVYDSTHVISNKNNLKVIVIFNMLELAKKRKILFTSLVVGKKRGKKNIEFH